MRVVVDKITYCFYFRYNRTWTKKTPSARSKPIDQVTHCFIGEINGKGQTLLAQGTVRCHPNDIFSKEDGRKKSLTKALEKFDRKTRSKFWEVYFDRIVESKEFKVKEIDA